MAIQYLSFKNARKRSTSIFGKNDVSQNAIEQVIEYCYREKFIDHEDYAESLKIR